MSAAIRLVDGQLRCQGPREAVEALLPVLRDQRAFIAELVEAFGEVEAEPEPRARFWTVRFADGSSAPLCDASRPRTRAEVLDRARKTMSDRGEVVDVEPCP